MFEKEAEEEINKEHWNYSVFKDLAQEYWQKGAEYGYNKALDEATHNYNAIIADYDKRIAELEKENAELKKELVEKGQHLDLTEKEWGKDLVQMYYFKTLYTKQTDQLTKAKEIIRDLLSCLYSVEYDYISDLEEAEQFLKKAE